MLLAARYSRRSQGPNAKTMTSDGRDRSLLALIGLTPVSAPVSAQVASKGSGGRLLAQLFVRTLLKSSGSSWCLYRKGPYTTGLRASGLAAPCKGFRDTCRGDRHVQPQLIHCSDRRRDRRLYPLLPIPSHPTRRVADPRLPLAAVRGLRPCIWQNAIATAPAIATAWRVIGWKKTTTRRLSAGRC